MCGSGTRSTLNLTPPPLNFFFIFWSWKKTAEQNNFVLLSNPTSEFGEKKTYQKDHLRRKSKFLCIQSLFGIGSKIIKTRLYLQK